MTANKFMTSVICCFLFTVNASYAQSNERKCAAPEYQQFDFWLGDWIVKDSSGKVVGSNKVFQILGTCAISENWEGASGTTGKSYNFFDNQRKVWHQTWVDDSGGVLYLDGKLEKEIMILSGSRPGKSGEGVDHQISYTPMKDGGVKQHWRFSKDKGATWKDLFIGYYSRR